MAEKINTPAARVSAISITPSQPAHVLPDSILQDGYPWKCSESRRTATVEFTWFGEGVPAEIQALIDRGDKGA